MAQIHKIMYPAAWVSLGPLIHRYCEKRPLWGLPSRSWLVFPQDQVCEHIKDDSPSLIPPSLSAYFSTAGSSQAQRQDD